MFLSYSLLSINYSSGQGQAVAFGPSENEVSVWSSIYAPYIYAAYICATYIYAHTIRDHDAGCCCYLFGCCPVM